LRDPLFNITTVDKKKPPVMGGFSVTSTSGLVDLDPDTLAPITVSAPGLAPTIPVLLAFFPPPIIRHDAELKGRLVGALLFHAPAVAFIVADNGG
jgi:hypothetical protein